jgi:pilus assembly protein FimV
MGILDDAIREHLELIRRRGAADSEVRRLEDEAFGPPTRPDEADFPESEEGAGSGNGVATEAAIEEPENVAAHEDVTTLLPAEEAGEPPAEMPGTGLEEPTGAHITGDVDEEEGEPVLGERVEEPAGEVETEEPIAEEHAIVEEPPVEEAEEEPPGAEATSLYDQGEGEGMDIDLDLALEEEGAAEEAPSEEHPAHEPEGAVPLEPPIESLDTVEHPFPDEITEGEEPHEESAPSDEHDVVHEEEAAAPEGDEEAEDSDEGAEDVLADTPEFLKDQPEDDELWFEQGEPKDFDF